MSLASAYSGRRVLVTGHTGFKGSWLTLWLEAMGAEVKGVALAPEGANSHWLQLGMSVQSELLDIRNAEQLSVCMRSFSPHVVFHLAAQSLVRRGYDDPLSTWSTNVVGTANVLEACRACPELQAILVVTTDKCYENEEWCWPYRETDALGGKDPYSASKAATELVAASYRRSFFAAAGSPLLATARAGNVIGGGDWSVDRLIPDLARAMLSGAMLEVRNPASTRPWQHVLDCLGGYLHLGQELLEGRREFADSWNFGPDDQEPRSVAEVLAVLAQHWPGLSYRVAAGPHPAEARQLSLDSSKARQLLRFRPMLSLDRALALTATWYREFLQGSRVVSRAQLDTYRQALES